MESYANSLSGGHDPSVVKAIPYGVFDKDAAEEISAAITASALVVDCSASIAVGRYISHKLAGNTRAVSFFYEPIWNVSHYAVGEFCPQHSFGYLRDAVLPHVNSGICVE